MLVEKPVFPHNPITIAQNCQYRKENLCYFSTYIRIHGLTGPLPCPQRAWQAHHCYPNLKTLPQS